MSVTIRDASTRDIDQLIPLIAAFHHEHSRMIGGSSTRSLAEIAEEVERFLDSSDGGYIVAIASTGDLVGFRRWELHDGFYLTRDLYVVEGTRRHGVARALIRHFEQWLREHGQTVACISCTPHNMAMIALARSEGYRTLNMIEMRKDLLKGRRKPWGQVEALGLVWELL
jgi:GNAT superfamily N-acetyltransferase